MAFVFYMWLIPLLMVVGAGMGGLYVCLKREWPSQSENRSDLEIALEMEAREDREAAARANCQPA